MYNVTQKAKYSFLIWEIVRWLILKCFLLTVFRRCVRRDCRIISKMWNPPNGTFLYKIWPWKQQRRRLVERVRAFPVCHNHNLHVTGQFMCEIKICAKNATCFSKLYLWWQNTSKRRKAWGKTGRNLAPWVYFQTQKELWIEKIAGIFYDDGYFSSRAKNASPSIRTAFPGFSPVTISPKRKVNQLQRIYFL